MPYNPNSIWTSKDNPNLPRSARSTQKAGPTPPSQPKTPSDPKPEPQPKPRRPEQPEPPQGKLAHRHSLLGKYGLWIFGIGLLAIVGGALWLIYILRPPAQPATKLVLSPPSSIQVGTPFTVALSATNDSNIMLSGAVVALQLPQGVEFVGSDAATQVQEYPLGDIAPGQVITQSSTVIVTGSPDTIFAVSSKLLYTTAQTPSTTYETDRAASFSAGPSSVSVTYSAPTDIVSGQNFPITVNYVNSGPAPVTDAEFTMQYPSAYTFATSSIPVTTGTNGTAWDIGTVAPGQGGSFTLTGEIAGPLQTQYQFVGALVTNLDGQQYQVNGQSVNFQLVQAPLSLSIVLNSSPNYVAHTSDGLNYILSYTNNSAATLSSVKITAALTGSMYNFSTLQTPGSFNSSNDVITWSAANTPALASLGPGQSGTVSFTIKTASTYPIRLPSDKDFTLGVIGAIQSPTVIPGQSGTSTVSVVTQSAKVGGAIAFSSQGYWKSGPFPPKVDQPTTYTINWSITNYSTDASNVTVSAYLESGTSFVGVATTTGTTAAPIYDAGTGLITWTIPSVAAGTGITDAPVSVQFVVSNTPAVNQVGGNATLLGAATLNASDTWGGGSLSAKADAVTSAIPNDKSVGKNGNRSVTN